jgi:IstB-like ATP binding protein
VVASSAAAGRDIQPALRARFNHRHIEPAIDEWTSVFGSERLTGALLDRLTHHVHILEMNGDSYRLNQSKRRSRRNNADTPKDELTPT